MWLVSFFRRRRLRCAFLIRVIYPSELPPSLRRAFADLSPAATEASLCSPSPFQLCQRQVSSDKPKDFLTDVLSADATLPAFIHSDQTSEVRVRSPEDHTHTHTRHVWNMSYFWQLRWFCPRNLAAARKQWRDKESSEIFIRGVSVSHQTKED